MSEIKTKALVLPDGYKRKIALVRMWPGIETAEDEVIARVQNTCKLLGLESEIVDTSGRQIDYPHEEISKDDVDFVIHLHFETPKAYDAISLVALWNPLDFYFEWGYRRYTDNLMTHDDFLSCGSDTADDHVKRMVLNSNSHLQPSMELFHSLCEPFYEPELGERKIFYVGINWEKLGKGKGRHDGLLRALEATGDLQIYGPKIFQDVDVWEGYDCYVGPIDFDGVSIIKAIRKAGISLVLSSDAHKRSSLMSSRLFESLAAGAIIIADENAFAKDNFGDTLLYIETIEKKPEQVTRQVRKHLEWIEENPKEAIAKAKAAQEIFKSKFDMATSITNIYQQLPDRIGAINDLYLAKTEKYKINVLGMILRYEKGNIKNILDSLECQTYKNKTLVFLIDSVEYKLFEKKIDKLLDDYRDLDIKFEKVNIFHRNKQNEVKAEKLLGPFLHDFISKIPEGELFTAISPNEKIFSDHLSSLVRPFEDDNELHVSHTDVILQHSDSQRRYFDLKKKVSPFPRAYNAPNGFSRMVVRKWDFAAESLVLPYIGFGFMDMYFSFADKIKRISRATCILNIQHLPYSADYLMECESQISVDAMSEKQVEDFKSKRFSLNEATEEELRYDIANIENRRINLKKYTTEERRELIAHLFEALSLPNWLMNIFRKIHAVIARK